ncbi:MAG: type II toxin-antitoxin system HigB family toxin [Deltaproteobacteria bacterium]|nr:type II toxin-antitoxin system HigB family toxin [Deltaproteobacteria bacterium]
MRVFNRRTLLDACAKHAPAAEALRAWWAEADKARWASIADVRADFPSADRVADRIIFNIKGNKYRLVVAYDFPRHSLFIKFFGTHAEYDKVDVAKVNQS